MSIIKRILAVVTTVSAALVAVSGTAFAGPAPIGPDSGTAGATPVVIDQVTTTSVSAWQLALLALTAAVVAAALTALFTAFTGRRRTTMTAHAQAA